MRNHQGSRSRKAAIGICVAIGSLVMFAVPAQADGAFRSRVRNLACNETEGGWGTVSGEGWMKEFGTSGTTHFEIRFIQQIWNGSKWLADETRVVPSDIFPDDAASYYWDWQGQTISAFPDDEGGYMRMKVVFQWWGGDNNPNPVIVPFKIHQHARVGPYCVSGGA